MATLNANPVVYYPKNINTTATSTSRRVPHHVDEIQDEDTVEPWTAEEIFDLIRNIKDPEHPQLTLEQLNVVQLTRISVRDVGANTTGDASIVEITFTPTIPHCPATLIGLCLRVKLIRSLPRRFKVRIAITPGKHVSELDINKQLNDKERVAAALENQSLLKGVNQYIMDDS